MIITTDLYKKKSECCGCEMCAQVCPKHIIQMKEDNEGFLYPIAFNPKECIDCNRCLRVCPLKNSYSGPTAKENYGGSSLDKDEVKLSSSGALASLISQQFIKDGGFVYGVEYLPDFTGAHYKRCTNLDDLNSLKGSKYCQSIKTDVHAQLRKDLKEHKVLFIGLPCDVHAIKLCFPNRSNLFTMALICHGPTSPTVQKDFVKILKETYQNDVTSFTVRGKITGWKPYYILADFTNDSRYKTTFSDSIYGIAFSILKRPSCGNCKFKLHNSSSNIDSDLILGDFHGIKKSSPVYNTWGNSQISILSEKGSSLLNKIREYTSLTPISLYDALHYNKASSNKKSICQSSYF